MNYFLRFDPPAMFNDGDGFTIVTSHVGPFDTYDKARLWALKANALLDARGVKDVFIETLDEPTDLN